MTEEQKQLLIKDLCGRLPYGVKVQFVKEGIVGVLDSIYMHLERGGNEVIELKCATRFYGDSHIPVEEFKPYLLPQSSMTKEQKERVKSYFNSMEGRLIGLEGRMTYLNDWFDKNHFDYRGLIKQGLAIDATDLNIYK